MEEILKLADDLVEAGHDAVSTYADVSVGSHNELTAIEDAHVALIEAIKAHSAEPDVIYLVTLSPGYLDDIFEGFATDAKGVERIVRSHYREHRYTQLTGIRVDMDAATVVATDVGGDWTYYIREIRRQGNG